MNGKSINVTAPALSPKQRAWLRFKANRRGYISLWVFVAIFLLSLCAEVLSNDKPVMVSYQGSIYFPIIKSYPETVFGGDFETEANYNDAYLTERLTRNGNWVWYAPNRYSYDSINLATDKPNPSPPSAQNLLGTDDRGRDVLARLIYGFRLSVLFALALTVVATRVGILAGALQVPCARIVPKAFTRFANLWFIRPGEFLLNGFRNRDLRTTLCPATKDQQEQRQQAAAITRKLALLKAHGLIVKVQKTHRYQLSAAGKRITTVLLTAYQADVNRLLDAA